MSHIYGIRDKSPKQRGHFAFCSKQRTFILVLLLFGLRARQGISEKPRWLLLKLIRDERGRKLGREKGGGREDELLSAAFPPLIFPSHRKFPLNFPPSSLI